MPNPTVPSTLNLAAYPPPFIAVPAPALNIPSEGAKCVPFKLDWSTLPAGKNAFDLNLELQGVSPPISQIASVWIDNTQSNQNVTLIAPDTGFEATCPARASGMFPVLTNGLELYFARLVFPSTPVAGDITNVYFVNQFMPPALFAAPKQLAFGSTGEIPMNANNSGALISAAEWELHSLNVLFCGAQTTAAGSMKGTLALHDGSVCGPIIYDWVVLLELASTAYVPIVLCDQCNIGYKSTQGGNLDWVYTAAGGGASAVSGSIILNVGAYT